MKKFTYVVTLEADSAEAAHRFMGMVVGVDGAAFERVETPVDALAAAFRDDILAMAKERGIKREFEAMNVAFDVCDNIDKLALADWIWDQIKEDK